MWVNAREFAKREGKKLYVIDVQASKDRKIGRTDRFRKVGRVLQIETERYYLAFKDPITPELKERIEELYYRARELVASDYELAWIAHKGTGSPHLNVLQRFIRFRWHRGGKIVQKMCENLEALLAMSEEARAEFLTRELEAMREASKAKHRKLYKGEDRRRQHRQKFKGEIMEHVATLSGGKDSTAMVDMLLRHGRPLDYIVFKDTLHEFELMYRYVERLSEYFKDRYNKEVITLKPEISFEDSVFGKISKGENEGVIRGLPAPQAMGFCTWRRDAKTRPFERWLKKQGIKECKIYIGYTTSEIHRKMAGDEFLYPLIDDFAMSETDCAAYLREHEMENPLYRYFTRTGCSFCPAQSDRSFFQVWKHFPKDWEYMKQIETKLLQLEKQGERVQNRYWFSKRRTCADMEKEFIKADKQSGLFDFSDEPLKNCFCRI